MVVVDDSRLKPTIRVDIANIQTQNGFLDKGQKLNGEKSIETL